MENAPKYFSTKFTVKMMGARYIPSVCYKLDEIIAPTVEKLVDAGEAHMYSEKVRFVNGVAMPVKKPEQQPANKAAQPVSGSAAANAGRKNGSKKGGRDFD